MGGEERGAMAFLRGGRRAARIARQRRSGGGGHVDVVDAIFGEGVDEGVHDRAPARRAAPHRTVGGLGHARASEAAKPLSASRSEAEITRSS